MNKKDFYYNLPPELIAQHPAQKRDLSKLLVYNRLADTTEHKQFCDICDYLIDGDVLVLNNTKVLPARIFSQSANGGKIEFLLLSRQQGDVWETLVKPAKKVKVGDVFDFGFGMQAKILGVLDSGGRLVEFVYQGVFEQVLDKIGEMPLPPYIKEKLEEKQRYQTVYAKEGCSAAAPTAGLHFTPELLEKLKSKGVIVCEVMLNVGLGTFRPVKCDDLTKHAMHSEYFSLSKQTADIINLAKCQNRRVIAVGTTSVRVLESCAVDNRVVPQNRDTNIFVYPPYNFQIVDGLITNFHLPESTLIMLVSAFCGLETTLELYNTAIANKYRFFSFGDAMLIV